MSKVQAKNEAHSKALLVEETGLDVNVCCYLYFNKEALFIFMYIRRPAFCSSY